MRKALGILTPGAIGIAALVLWALAGSHSWGAWEIVTAGLALVLIGLAASF